MKRFLESFWETISTILFILVLAVAMFPFGLYFCCRRLFN